MNRSARFFKFGITSKILSIFLLLVAFNILAAFYLLPKVSVALKTAIIVGSSSLFFFLLVTYLTFVIAGFFLAKNIQKNLEVLVNATNKISRGEFDDKISVKSTDEISSLAIKLEELKINLKERINSAEEAKNRAEAILFNVGEGVFAVNLKGEIIIFNHVAEQIIGFAKEQIMGQKYDQILQFYDTKTKKNYGSFIDQVLLEGRSVTLPADTVLVTASRAEIPVAVTSSPIKNQSELIVGGIVVFRDVTHEKEVEEIRSDLISIASHQLRTPLSEIKGLLSLLLGNIAGSLTIKQIEYLKLLEIANERMINLVNDLLNVSRLEQGRLQLNFQVIDLGSLSKEIFQGLKIKASERKQNFSLTIDPKLPPVIADPEKTKEIISNLMENALKYTFESGTIQARVTANTNGVWVLVADNGVGIPKNRQKDLFQKFSRVENPLSKITSGTGLGLYAVKQLVERQNGTIWFKSEEGKGSTFGFSLPITANVKV